MMCPATARMNSILLAHSSLCCSGAGCRQPPGIIGFIWTLDTFWSMLTLRGKKYIKHLTGLLALCKGNSSPKRIHLAQCKYQTTHVRLDTRQICPNVKLAFPKKEIAKMHFYLLLMLTLMWPLLFLKKPQAWSQFDLGHNMQ